MFALESCIQRSFWILTFDHEIQTQQLDQNQYLICSHPETKLNVSNIPQCWLAKRATLEIDLCIEFWRRLSVNFFWKHCVLYQMSGGYHTKFWSTDNQVVYISRCGRGSFTIIIYMTFERLVVNRKSFNWFKLAQVSRCDFPKLN